MELLCKSGTSGSAEDTGKFDILGILALRKKLENMRILRRLDLGERLEHLTLLQLLGLEKRVELLDWKIDSCKKSTRTKLGSPLGRKPLARP